MSNLPEKKQDASLDTPDNQGREIGFIDVVKQMIRNPELDPERLEKFLDLQFKMEEDQAKKAFMNAMSGFQGDVPSIPKSKKVDFSSNSGNRVKYNYAPLEEIVRLIKPHLQQWGLSFSFDIEKTEDKSEDKLITRITHRQGFSREYSYYFNPVHDDKRMNESQRKKSAVSFAKRAALENALGLVTDDEDTDANVPSGDATVSQMAEIKTLIDEVKPDMARFLKFLGAENIDSLTAAQAERAIHGLKQKRGQK